MKKSFLISGYWKETKKTFTDYLVKSIHTLREKESKTVFRYGFNETLIKEAMKKGEDTRDKFVITSYKEYK